MIISTSSLVFSPLMFVVCVIAYLLIANDLKPFSATQRRIAVGLVLALALGAGLHAAQVMVPDVCKDLTYGDFWWWYWGCFIP
jgi:hypothetical protein